MERIPNSLYMKYKEGNNRPSSVNQISLVHNHDKAGNKYYTQDNTDTRKTQVCEGHSTTNQNKRYIIISVEY